MAESACSINREFVKWKALYFLAAASQGPYVYFLVNFYISRGLSYDTAGFIESIVPFLGCIFRPLTCYFADRFALHRFLLASSVLIYAISLLGFVILSTRYELIVAPESASNTANETIFAGSNSSLNLQSGETVNRDYVIPVMCALRFLSTLGITPATSLLDGIIYHSLESKGQSANWGRQRLWGSIGFSSSALFASFLLDKFEKINFVIGFSMALVGAILFFIVSIVSVRSYDTMTPTKNKNEADDGASNALVATNVAPAEPKSKRNHFLYVLGFIFSDGQIVLVLVVAGAVGYLTAGRDIYASQYIESITKTNSKKIMGVMQGVIGTLEIPVMFTAGWFFKKIGTMPFFAACFAAFSLRFWLYTMLTADTVWYFVGIELLHIFCFGLVVPAMTFHAHSRVVRHQNVLPEMSTIMQGLVSALYLGLGIGIGSIAGGLLTQAYGGATCMLTFSLVGVGCFVIFCIVWLVIFIVSRNAAKKSKNEEPSAALPTEQL